ncbi:dTDP-4-amino-4,6-dideoxy-D-glucose ammonia-lyase [Streptomyces sp. PTY087I2]|uniref:dTDP-4-amino-4,6-dideoxy-D-glucose ammonia-lyase n=1 Tax=Streptomyces sp. PTY087I2 TaxID=1819298 RepID=UPI00080B3E28|nr:dTDP-4-amino-4,6-dideoxy-D-glucose ammonia-lyase [Streptomyces sp. PTY087I2]OCC10562.1 Radical SAM superfamily protein [Streptomyces sp. PTY087I2]
MGPHGLHESAEAVIDGTIEDAMSAFAPHVADALTALYVAGSGDGRATAESVRRRTGQLIVLARHLRTHPFSTLEGARSRVGADRAAFGELLRLLRTTDAVRDTVLDGPARKYWRNTVLPMERAGVFDDILGNRPRFPYRVGLYPGPTCMFRCSFCARMSGARYAASSLPDGERALAAVVDEAPADDPFTFYISGGLEPLTNPGAGALVRRIARRGMKASMYTNGFSLNAATLRRQPGLWDLHTLRISLYGTSEKEYAAVTTRTGAFARVRSNVADFLRERAERAAPVRVGFNYVILPGRAAQLPEVVAYLADLRPDSAGRPVDFLTVREDYSGREGGALSPRDRDELADAMHTAEKIAAERLPGLEIDYGYALHGIRHGTLQSLPRIDAGTMRPAAYPQASVVVDLLGDVYLYREAAFPELPGADRYVIGRVTADRGLLAIVGDFVASGREIVSAPGDPYFLDAFDQVVTARLNQVEADIGDGWDLLRGALR